jgi:chromosome segregation protein
MQDIDKNLGRLQEEMANNEKEKERLAQVVANSGTDKEKLRLDTEKLMQELKDITSGKDDFSGKKVELAEASAKANEQLTIVVSEKAKAEAKVHQNDVDQGRLDADYQNALTQLDTEYKMTLEEARASGLLHDQSDTALRRSEVKLQRDIEALGPINMAAIEQYQATKDRFEFLQKQYADLESAKSDLETVIAKLTPA